MAVPNKKLEAARVRKRWSVAVASEKAGVSVNTFNRWERGLQVPQLGTLDQVCKAFNLSPEELGFEDAIVVRRRGKSLLQTGSLPVCAQEEDLLSASLVPEADETQQGMGVLVADAEQTKRNGVHMKLAAGKRDCSEGVSRRQAMAALIGTPAAMFSMTTGGTTVLHPGEALALCTATIPLAWQLYFEGGLMEVERLLPRYLQQLAMLAQKTSSYQREAASLASQGHQLASVVALQRQNFGLACSYVQQAFAYGKLADDPNLLVASCIRRAQVYFCLKQPLLRVKAYEQALPYINDASLLLQGRVYIGLSETYSTLGCERDARRLLELGQSTFPQYYADDPAYTYTHFNHWSLASFQGMTYLNLNEPELAWTVFTDVDKIIPQTLIPDRIELTIRQTRAACKLKDRDLACSLLEAAVTYAKEAGSQLRCEEAYRIYERMQHQWHRDSKVQALTALFT